MAKSDTYRHEALWPTLQEAVEREGTPGLLAIIRRIVDPYERVSLYRFAIRGLMFRDWAGKNLDALIQIAEDAITDTLQTAQQSVQDSAWFKDQANIICYNMASNLADCWDDAIPRDTKHFEQGLDFAERAIRFREELKKGPGPFFMAYWAKGIHQLLLGRMSDAVRSLERSAHFAADLARAQGKSALAEKGAPFEVLLAAGYLAIAKLLSGQMRATADLEMIMGAFEEMKGLSSEAKADAELGIRQLKYVRKRFGH